MVKTKNYQLADTLIQLTEKTMLNCPFFPTTNITDFITIGTIRFVNTVDEVSGYASEISRNRFIDEIIKLARELVKAQMISDKLYKWKEPYKGQVLK